MREQVHAWYGRTCGERSSVALMRAADRALQPSAGPRGSRGAVDYYGGNPVAHRRVLRVPPGLLY